MAHQHLDCCTYAKLIQLILDGEATQEERNLFEQHLDCCKPCCEHFDLEKSLLDAIRNKMNHEIIPPQLVEAIRKKISTQIPQI